MPKSSGVLALTRDCMKALDRNIWRSSITTATMIRPYSAYILPVLLYGAETWTRSQSFKQEDRFVRLMVSASYSTCPLQSS